MRERWKRLRFGFSLAIKGVKAASKNQETSRFYLWYVSLFSLLTLGLLGGGSFALWSFVTPSVQAAWYVQIGLWLVVLLGMMSSLLLAPLIAFFTLNAGVPLVQERLLFSALEHSIPQRTAWLRAQEGLPLYLSILHSLRRLVGLMLLFVVSFLLSFIPLLGPALAFGLQLYFSAPLLSSEFLEPYFEKLGMNFQEQKRASLDAIDELRGFGSFCLLVVSLPVVGAFFIGVLQAAAAQLVLEVYEREAVELEQKPSVET